MSGLFSRFSFTKSDCCERAHHHAVDCADVRIAGKWAGSARTSNKSVVSIPQPPTEQNHNNEFFNHVTFSVQDAESIFPQAAYNFFGPTIRTEVKDVLIAHTVQLALRDSAASSAQAM